MRLFSGRPLEIGRFDAVVSTARGRVRGTSNRDPHSDAHAQRRLQRFSEHKIFLREVARSSSCGVELPGM